jgi:formylglycine-generating enzyme required for sulfatase activity
LVQWFQIRWLTRKKAWTPSQQKMMRRASRYHQVWVVVVAVLLFIKITTLLTIRNGYEADNNKKVAEGLVGQVVKADTVKVPGIVEALKDYRPWTDPLLWEKYGQAQDGTVEKLHLSLALLPVDKGQVKYLRERLLHAQSQELLVVREALLPYQDELSESLWSILKAQSADKDVRLRAACALAAFTPEDPRWTEVSEDVAALLVSESTLAEAFQPVGKNFLPLLAEYLGDEQRSGFERKAIAAVYKTLAEKAPDAVDRLEKVLAVRSKAEDANETKAALARRQANVGVALVVMGQGEKVWPNMKRTPDPTLRSFLIDRMSPGGVEGKVLWNRLEAEKDVTIRRAMLVSLGEFGLDRLSPMERRKFVPRLVQLYREDPDSGVHGATDWLLRQWQTADEQKDIDQGLATGKVEGRRQWYINGQRQTMVVVDKPGEFWMGEGATRHKEEINRSYVIAARHVTVEQFLRFRKDHTIDKRSGLTSDCPVNNVSWYDAAAYCNWLSEREGIPKDQWCYEPNEKNEYAEGMKTAANYLERIGYRLPTEAEWEFACRAGADTAFSFGEPEDLVGKYAWSARNSSGKSHPVGTLRPNDLGLFDMHGNILGWCQDLFDEAGLVFVMGGDKNSRVLRGGSQAYDASRGRSAYRHCCSPSIQSYLNGFRPARTFKP